LTLTLDGGKWLASRPDRFALRLWVTSVATEQKAAWASESDRTLGRVIESLARTGNETMVPLVPVLPLLVGRLYTVLSVVK
jgi:hypothetical protein